MSVISTISNLGSSLTGNIKKAVLIFGTGSSSASAGASIGGTSLKAMTAQMLNRSGLTNESLIDTTGARYLEVQYNPSSIRFSASVDAVQMRSLQNSMEEGVLNQSCRGPSIVMTVDLVFNDVNVKDAFMADKFRVSANDIVTDVSSSVINAMRGGYTVQPQCNGLLASTVGEEYRFVTFQWADMSFSGELTDVNVQYGMFSVSGKPIHGVVTLRITQQLSTSAEETKWNTSKFDECFNNKQNRSTGQVVSNLINITGF